MLPTPPASPKPTCTSQPSDRLGEILAGQYQLTDVLGVGAYGVVYKAIDIHNGVYYAVKALNKVGLEPRQQSFQQREIQLHYQVSQHQNIVSMENILDSSDCTYVVMEYCPEGDLFAKITEEERYIGNDELARSVFLQIVEAVEFCHSVGIYHRDLKPENVLVKDGGMTVKLADFGLATKDYYTSDFGCGSTFYMSPECQESNPQPMSYYLSPANDVWSLGVILVNLTCGRNPWKRASREDSTFRAYMKDRNFLKTILPLSDELDAILRKCFEPDARRRCSIAQLHQMILQCPRFTKTTAVAPPSPPYSPIEPVQDVFPTYVPAVAPVQQSYEYQANHVLATRFSQLSTQTGYKTPVHTPKPRSPYMPSQPKMQMCGPQTYFSSVIPWCNNFIPSLSKHATFIPPRVF
ncbi:hypothetical protein B9Z65_232 [Elsinoe australis]|uniref:Autophagy-related protein 1 n=1 Tax=Elsinoe australis TaxID=40998 RepID=A0A2P7Z7R0_9PEZI|nr:hypothetical protein B9Z65_232 [Elsinoe australis]